jgi:hypothetical protein
MTAVMACGSSGVGEATLSANFKTRRPLLGHSVGAGNNQER